MTDRFIALLIILCSVVSAKGDFIKLPLESGAACLDGSPYGFYFHKSASASTQWTISFQGGGWCYNERACLSRSSTTLGSSKHWAKRMGCGCMNVKDASGLANDCNCIFMPYCDGASFSGYTDKPVAFKSHNLTFRGMRNLDATVEYALDNLGMQDSTQLVVTGESAGGLAAFLHVDRVSRKVRSRAPKCKTVRGAPFVGYFLDHDNVRHSKSNYTAWMKYIFRMQNLTAESQGGTLSDACLKANSANPHYCFMSPHMHSFIETPYFVFNSKYDAWQLANELQVRINDPTAQNAILHFGEDFMKQFTPVLREKQNGAMIISCVCHGCPWSKLYLDGKLYSQHFAEWLLGLKNSGFVIDTSGPNGNGTITLSGCEALPKPQEPLRYK